MQSALENIVVAGIEDITTVFSPKGQRVSIRDNGCFGLSFCTDGAGDGKYKRKTKRTVPGGCPFDHGVELI